MKKRVWMPFLSMLLVATMLLLNGSVLCLAASSPSFYVKNVAAVEKNSSFVAEVFVQSDQTVQVNGMAVQLKYDQAKIAYVQNSARSAQTGFTDIVTYGKHGEVKLVWDSLHAADLKTGKLFQFTFETLEDFSDTQISLEITSLYHVSGAVKDIPIGSCTAGKITLKDDSAVHSVVAKIDAIGQVQYTEACRKNIDSAWEAYYALSSAERASVSNYKVLVTAMQTYATLERANAESRLLQEIAAYKKQHAYAFSLTRETVSNATLPDGSYKDVVALKAAIAGMEDDTLTMPAKARLLTNKYDLVSVLAYLEDMLADEIAEKDEAAREAAKKAAAEEAVAEFNAQDFNWVFKLTIDTVTIRDETGVREVLNALASYEINEYAVEMLAPKKAQLQALLEKIEALLIALHPEDAEQIRAANDFKNTFSYVLGLTPQSVTLEDEIDVNVVYYAYELLDDDVKIYLEKEGALLESLMNAIAKLPAGEKPDGDGAEIENTGTEENTKPNTLPAVNAKNYAVKFMNKAMNRTVWKLLILNAVLLVNFVVCYVLFKTAKSKQNKREGA